MTPQQKAKDKRDRDFYNLLPGERKRIAEFQGGKDPITGQPLKPHCHLDHRHTDGLARGLLNPMSNRRLIENVETLRAMLAYLLDPPAPKALGEAVYGLIGRAKRKKVMRYGPTGTPTPQPRRPR